MGIVAYACNRSYSGGWAGEPWTQKVKVAVRWYHCPPAWSTEWASKKKKKANIYLVSVIPEFMHYSTPALIGFSKKFMPLKGLKAKILDRKELELWGTLVITTVLCYIALAYCLSYCDPVIDHSSQGTWEWKGHYDNIYTEIIDIFVLEKLRHLNSLTLT